MLLLIPNGSLREDRTTLSVTRFPMRSSLAKYLTSSLYRSRGYLQVQRSRQEKNKQKIQIPYSNKTHCSHRLDAHNCWEVSPQSATREDYSLIVNRSEIENIMQILRLKSNILTMVAKSQGDLKYTTMAMANGGDV